eukprot:1143743-Pleurochrysis_carterae.AAC.1
MLGFPGAVCSIDGVHIAWHRCPATHSALCAGKEKVPTRVFNVAVGSTRRIFHVTLSSPGTRNDKALAKYGTYMQAMHNGLYKLRTSSLCCTTRRVTVWSTRDCMLSLMAAITCGWRCRIRSNI